MGSKCHICELKITYSKNTEMETKECEISRTDTFLFVRRAQEKQHYWLSTKRCSNNNSYFTKHQASSDIFSSGSVGSHYVTLTALPLQQWLRERG